MRSYDEISADAKDEPAFSNGTEWDAWSDRWCGRCLHDVNEDCPLVMVALLAATPVEWREDNPGSLGDRYTCTQFVDRGTPVEELPVPVSDGQAELSFDDAGDPDDPWRQR